MKVATTESGRRAVAWVYEGTWGVLSSLFKVNREPPTLPAAPGEEILIFHPAEGYLRYLKFWFWIVLAVVDVAILVVWLVILFVSPIVGVLLAVPALAIAIVPDILAYIAIHLRYDTTWYVMTDRSLRIRRGIITIREITITFENVQNVSIAQGPVQRLFGIADVVVRTAGGGSGTGPHGEQIGSGHEGRIEGIDCAPVVRDRIMARVRRSTSAGLGDDAWTPGTPVSTGGWTRQHLDALRDIRNEARRLAAAQH